MRKVEDLKQSVEALAKKEDKTQLEIINLLQVGAVKIGNDELLDQLCDLKWEYLW